MLILKQDFIGSLLRVLHWLFVYHEAFFLFFFSFFLNSQLGLNQLNWKVITSLSFFLTV